jgi:hypothetical protein
MEGETLPDSFKIARNYRTLALETEGEKAGILSMRQAGKQSSSVFLRGQIEKSY